jgi:hypothetical protein
MTADDRNESNSSTPEFLVEFCCVKCTLYSVVRGWADTALEQFQPADIVILLQTLVLCDEDPLQRLQRLRRDIRRQHESFRNIPKTLGRMLCSLIRHCIGSTDELVSVMD